VAGTVSREDRRRPGRADRSRESGLLRPDSSIWETHWNGRQRHFAYTSITAARGLCDAGDDRRALGDASTRDEVPRRRGGAAGRIADELTRPRAEPSRPTPKSSRTAEGYWDAAVLDAIAMGLFHPQGNIAQATLAGLDGHLRVNAGPGWSRNDDRYDHAGGVDLSPWGSDYDSAEWVITDLRGAIAKREAGDGERADRLMAWVRDQAHANYLSVAETFDENDGTYKFNTPMVGFGAGAYALALAQRAGAFADPACGAYFLEEGGSDTDSGSTGDPTGTSGASEPGTASTVDTPTDGSATSPNGATESDSDGDPSQAGTRHGHGRRHQRRRAWGRRRLCVRHGPRRAWSREPRVPHLLRPRLRPDGPRSPPSPGPVKRCPVACSA
jgi:hypothetical protein